MSPKPLALCLSMFALAACEEPQRLPPLAAAPPPPPAKALPAPTAVAPPRDAGPLDGLALVHDTPQVDHLAVARRLAEDGDGGGALAEARRALYSQPDDEEALTFIARQAQRLGRPSVAAEAFARLAAQRPDDATALVQQGRALLQLKDFAGALAVGRQAIRRDEGNPEGHQLVGLGHLGRRELGPAMASFEKAVALAPQHGWALNNLGYACLLAGEDRRAVEVLAQAAALLPQAAAVQNNLGVALERAGRAEEAKAAYQKAMDLSPRYVKARLNAARVARLGVPEADEPLPEPTGLAGAPVPDDAHPLPAPGTP
jgi:tetratricopeptide (TPR) repeat protein